MDYKYRRHLGHTDYTVKPPYQSWISYFWTFYVIKIKPPLSKPLLWVLLDVVKCNTNWNEREQCLNCSFCPISHYFQYLQASRVYSHHFKLNLPLPKHAMVFHISGLSFIFKEKSFPLVYKLIFTDENPVQIHRANLLCPLWPLTLCSYG